MPKAEMNISIKDIPEVVDLIETLITERNVVQHQLAAVRSVVVEFKAAGEYEFKAETAPEAFLQQEIRSLLDDLYEALGMNR